MMKIFFILLSTLSLNAHSLEKYVCTTDTLKLEIIVSESTKEKTVNWILSLISDSNTRIEGFGPWHKEMESEDAFSAYNDDSAISYKNKRAVFVNGDSLGDAILFPVCEK